jgi:hypothetical protein
MIVTRAEGHVTVCAVLRLQPAPATSGACESVNRKLGVAFPPFCSVIVRWFDSPAAAV